MDSEQKTYMQLHRINWFESFLLCLPSCFSLFEITSIPSTAYFNSFEAVKKSPKEKSQSLSKSIVAQFTPLTPYETPEALEKICAEYNRIIGNFEVEPLIAIPIFIHDFLCIHPFNDGNGRMSRLLTTLLLYRHIKAQRTQILDKEHRCRSGVTLTE